MNLFFKKFPISVRYGAIAALIASIAYQIDILGFNTISILHQASNFNNLKIIEDIFWGIAFVGLLHFPIYLFLGLLLTLIICIQKIFPSKNESFGQIVFLNLISFALFFCLFLIPLCIILFLVLLLTAIWVKMFGI